MKTAMKKKIMRVPMLTIEDNNLSRAWARGFISAAERGVDFLSPLVVTINLNSDTPLEILAIRKEVDMFLSGFPEIRSCHTTANTIFPSSLWNRQLERKALFDRYFKILPKIKKHRVNQYGVYFERMIAFGEKRKNQLDSILSGYEPSHHRASALQLGIFDPMRDQTTQPQRGFPCLQQVNFIPLGSDGLHIIGTYATQLLADRAYGNYLGLHNLGQFVAHELGMTLIRVTCIAQKAEIGKPSKSQARQFVERISPLLDQTS
jgi:hypothetical protein